MAHAYTPGLEIKKATTVRKIRRLPIKGNITVRAGDIVDYDDIVARTEIQGDPYVVKVSYLLKCEPDEMETYMVKRVGDQVKKNEVIAQFIGFFGLLKNLVMSPVDGQVESISTVSGQVIVREKPIPVEVDAYIPGKITDVLPREGVVIESNAAFIQGIFGVGGEAHGELATVAESPEEVLTPDHVKTEHKGKIILGGSIATGDALQKAVSTGVKGIVVGGIENADLRKIVGYDIGVAITGFENIGLTLIVTEGFGKMNMARRTYDLLNTFEGKIAHINGETQIRAGVIRPEIIIPHDHPVTDQVGSERHAGGMIVGTTVRVIREPNFGKLAKVISLPSELQKTESESLVRVVEIELEGGQKVSVPRANVEIIEE
jgi:hypothetical protein